MAILAALQQTGKGTINLIGSTNFDLASTSNKLTFYKSTTENGNQGEITGEGITINAIFTGSNPLGNNGVAVSSSTRAIPADHKTSTANIGQTDEKTIYHILFDYTSSNLTFGTHHAYIGNIYGLTSDSVIKFKNAGYIDGTQIENTDATILLDNTQLKSDFRNDNAILDFRNGRSTIGGNILTSDKTNQKLSQKVLTFDLTNSTRDLGFNKAIQAGYKVAPTYTSSAQSVLTFQNAPALSLGNDGTRARGSNTNPSDFIKALANDAGFSGIGSAHTEETDFTSKPNERNTERNCSITRATRD